MIQFNKDLCVMQSFKRIVSDFLILNKTSVYKDKNSPFKVIHTGLEMNMRNDKSYPNVSAQQSIQHSY